MGMGLTNYAAIVGTLNEEQIIDQGNGTALMNRAVGAIFPGQNVQNHWRTITDGMSNTILFAERSEPVCWMDPTGDVPIKVAVQGINAVKNGLGSLDGTEGINVAFCDGNVSFAPSMRPNQMLTAALTCNGGESVEWKPNDWQNAKYALESSAVPPGGATPLPLTPLNNPQRP